MFFQKYTYSLYKITTCIVVVVIFPGYWKAFKSELLLIDFKKLIRIINKRLVDQCIEQT